MDHFVAQIGVEGCNYSFDSLFSYIVPTEMTKLAEPGERVLVPFGNSDTLRQGMIFDITILPDDECRKLKQIHSLLDYTPLLDDEILLLTKWIRERCFTTYFNCVKAVLPGGMCLKTDKQYSVCCDISPDILSSLTEDERMLISYIASKHIPVKAEILKKKIVTDNLPVILKKLVKNNVLTESISAFPRSKELSVQTLLISDSFDYDCQYDSLTSRQKDVIDLLLDEKELTVKEICYYSGVSDSVVKTMLKKGLLATSLLKVTRSPVENINSEKRPKPLLSARQTQVFNELYDRYKKGVSDTALLYGITGSGKTSVYLELIDRVLEDGKTVIVLVPEISLTPQTFSLFTARYGKDIAILHSALSMGERYDEWHRIKDGKAKVVIGTRSAIFAPLKNIGLIVIDEEQEHTYKSEQSPRYNAKDVAKFRCAYNNALLVFASATPSVDTYAKAVSGKYSLSVLNERFGTAVLPEVKIIDMTDKSLLSPYMSISTPLAEEIETNLENGEQTILLVNRRGYNTFVVCSDCKEVLSCPRCSISLTYHNANRRLMCHYCGYSIPYTEKCPSCGAENIRYSGAGTQKIEQELAVRFPDAKVLRMDADTTLGKNAHEKLLSSFGSGDYDILIGTQMVAKGLDFSDVTLVGIISADNELYNTDFRCSERTFDLITQVVGRAGRGKRKGRAVIQTLTPENNTVNIAAVQDYERFYEGEISLRKAMIYPPFCDICEISFSGPDKIKTETCAADFFDKLKQKNQTIYNNQKMIILGPLAPRVSKINNYYRSRLIIKCINNSEFRLCIDEVLKIILKDKAYKDILVYADMNPESLN